VCDVLSLRSVAWRSVLEPFRKAERALLRSVKRVKLKEDWSMFNEDGAILEMILALNKISRLVGLSTS
jgi:hypothetical protein